MATKWNAARDQNLLLLIIKDAKINYPTLSEKWAAKYPEETFKPSARAISQHIDKLKKTSTASSDTIAKQAGSATTWTAARDQDLLLLLVQDLKIDYASVSLKWAAKYPNETKPSARAISQHVDKLKKTSGNVNTNSKTVNATSSVATPATPRGQGTPAKPRGKRSRAEMKNEESSEDEATEDQASPAKKRETPRRSVTRKSYKEEEFSEDEDANASGEEASGGDQDDFLTSGRATSRTVDFGADKADSVISRTIDFGADKADSAISNMSSPSMIAEEHTPASLADDQFGQDMFHPIDSIARSQQSASRPFGRFDFFGNPVPEDNVDDWILLKK
ncbi:hypothetical protein TI39_contig354g00059 [Zymoseptoria brevis]|uniref:Uncharacterized protein n=1 Tax=Zymoseptoria brevis TaxID=1047168 RepID=A0A0F4GQW3_9PEZI|nr:hypothetical protein TI39_contig354g00059 [Zymoseptoria brevis]